MSGEQATNALPIVSLLNPFKESFCCIDQNLINVRWKPLSPFLIVKMTVCIPELLGCYPDKVFFILIELKNITHLVRVTTIFRTRNQIMKNLTTAWKLWEEAEKGWEDGEPEGEKLEGQKQPSDKPKSYEKPETTVLQTKTPSGFNTLEAEKTFVPGKDKDAKVMQLETEIAELEEALMVMELEEAFMTPDAGTSLLGGPMAMALQPPNGYGKNFDSDQPAPEENQAFGYNQDGSDTLVAQRQFIPKEDLSKIMEAIEWNRKTRLAKLF